MFPSSAAKKYATFNAGLKATANTNLIQQAISKLGITSYFNSPNLPLTVFAPTDQVSLLPDSTCSQYKSSARVWSVMVRLHLAGSTCSSKVVPVGDGVNIPMPCSYALVAFQVAHK